MVGPDGDIVQAPAAGDFMPYHARFNQGSEITDAVPGAGLIELSPVEVAAVQEAEIVTAAEVAADDPFEPFAPELLVGLKDETLHRLQKLESVLTKLSTKDRGPALEKVYSELLAAHDRIEKRLEKRLEKREKRKGRGAKLKALMKKLHRRKVINKAKKDDGKAAKIEQIKAAYHSGGITRDRAEKLIAAVVKPGKQLEHPKLVAARLAAKTASA